MWVYLHSNLCSGFQNTHIFAPECIRVRFGRLRSSKVDDFGTNRKRECDFLLVRHCDYGPILHRFWDTATYWLKIAYIFPTPLSFAPSLPMFPLEFCGEVKHEGTRVYGAIPQWRPHAWWLLESFWHSASVWRTDRRTDGFTIANTALCIASYADAL